MFLTKKRIKSQRQGFTVIEVLLALSLFSLVALCAYSIFASAVTLSRRFEQHEDTYRQVRLTFDIIETDLSNMADYDFSYSYPDKISCIGEKDKVTFLLPTEHGLKAVSYYLETPEKDTIHTVVIGKTNEKNVDMVIQNQEDTPVYILVRDERDFIDYLNDTAEGNKEIVAANIPEEGVQFLYGSFDDEEQLAWTDSWADSHLPAAVRVTVTMMNPYAPEGKLFLEKDIKILG